MRESRTGRWTVYGADDGGGAQLWVTSRGGGSYDVVLRHGQPRIITTQGRRPPGPGDARLGAILTAARNGSLAGSRDERLESIQELGEELLTAIERKEEALLFQRIARLSAGAVLPDDPETGKITEAVATLTKAGGRPPSWQEVFTRLYPDEAADSRSPSEAPNYRRFRARLVALRLGWLPGE